MVAIITDVMLCHKTDSFFPAELTNTPLKKENKIIGRVFVFNNISERIKIEKIKDEFISTVSHELRTPLTSIKGSLGLLLGGVTEKLSIQTTDMLQLAYDNSDRLNILINDLLDLSKLDSLGFHLVLAPIELNNQIEKAINSNLGYAEKFHINIKSATDIYR